MATRTISTKLAIEGENEYKAALKNANSELRLLKSTLAVVSSEYDGNANSIKALTAKGDALNQMYVTQEKKLQAMKTMLDSAQKTQNTYTDKIDDYKSKLAAAQEELQALADSTEDTSEEQTKLQEKIAALSKELEVATAKETAAKNATDSYQTAVNYAQRDLNELNAEIKLNDKYLDEAANSTDGCATSIDEFGKETKEAAEEVDEGNKSVERLSQTLAAAGIAKTIKEITEAFIEFATGAAKFADNILTLSAQTGISAEKLQEYSYAAELVDVSVETITNSMTKNIKSMKGVQDGTKLSVEAYKKLNVEVLNADGTLRDSEEVYGEVIDALGKMKNETERDAVAMEILGKSAQDLNPLIQAGADKLAKLGKEAHDAGYIMSKETLEAAGGLDDSLQRLTLSSEALKNEIGTQLAPTFSALSDAGTEVLTWITDFIGENEFLVPILTTVVTGAGAYLAAISGLLIIKNVLPLLKGLNAALWANPWVLIAAGAAAVVTAITLFATAANDAEKASDRLADSLKATNEKYKETIDAIKDEETNTLGMIKTLEKLSEKEEKTAADKQLILDIVEQLNEEIPELNLAYDEQTDSLNLTTEALKKLAIQQYKQANQSAIIDKLKEAYIAQYDYNEEIKIASEAYDELKEKTDKARQGISDMDYAAGRVPQTFLNLQIQTAAAYDELENLRSGMANNGVEIRNLEADYEALNTAQTEATANALTEQEKTAAGIVSLGEYIINDWKDKITAITGEMDLLQQAYDDTYTAAYDTLTEQMGLFEKLDGTAKQSIDDLIASLESQITFMDDYAENIKLAMEKGVDEGLVQKLSDGSQESAQILAAIVQGTEEDIDKLNEKLGKVEEGKVNFSEQVAEMATNFDEEMGELEERMSEAVDKLDMMEEATESSKNTIQGAIDGIVQNEGLLIGKYKKLGEKVTSAYNNSLEIKSPSGKFKQSSAYTIQGAIIGVEENMPKLEAVYEKTAERSLAAMNTAIPSSTSAPSATVQNMAQIEAILGAIKGGGSTVTNNYGAAQDVTVLQVGDEIVSTAVKNKVSSGIEKTSTGIRGALGYA